MRKCLWILSAIAVVLIALGLGKTSAKAAVGDDLFAAATWSQGTNYGTPNPASAARKWAEIPAEAGATYTVIANKTDWRGYVYPANATGILGSSIYTSITPSSNGATFDIQAPEGTTRFLVTVYPNPDVSITDELWTTFGLQMIKSESPEKEEGDLFADAVWNQGTNYGTVNPAAFRRYTVIPCEAGDTFKFKARSGHWHMYIYPATADGILDSSDWKGFAPNAAGTELIYSAEAYNGTEPTELRITAYHVSPDANPLTEALFETFDIQMFKMEAEAPKRTVTTHTADGSTETHEYELWPSTATLPAPAGDGYEKYYYLDEDVSVNTQGVFTAANQKLYIDLNGHTIKSTHDRFYYLGATGADQPVTLVIANGTIEWAADAATNGWGYGFYLNTKNSLVIFDNVTFKNGAATGGTGDYNAFVHLNDASVSAHFFDAIFDNCDSVGGSAIAVSAGNVWFHSGEIKNCDAAKNGGAVYVNAGTFTMESGSIHDCTAANGAAVYVNTNGTFTMNGGSLYKNKATGDRGGAVMCNGGKVNIGGTALIGGSADNANKVTSSYGAGVHMAGGTFTMTGGEISYHTSAYAGANLSLFNAVGNITGGKITNGTLTDGNGSHGGGNICVYDGAQLKLGGEAVVSDGANNGSATFGGNIFARSLSDRSSNVTVEGNAKVLNGRCANGKGGNIGAKTQGGSKHETITIAGNAVVDGGTAKEGGNISLESAGSAFIIKDQAKVSNGTATACGGNVNFAAACTITVEGGTIENGTAATHSGNIRGNGSTFTMSGGTITGGKTNGNHGGNMTLSGTFTMTGGTIENGNSNTFGGNIYHDGATFTMSGGTITGGKAKTYGGNVNTTKAVITISGTAKITNGTAGTYGGNIVIPGGTAAFTMSGGEISNGVAETAHGGNMTCGGTFTMTGGTITGGKAEASRAGNIYIAKSFEMSGGEISNGVAMTGGNIVIESQSISMTISGTAVITGGQATTLTKDDSGTITSGFGGNIDTTGAVTIEGSAVVSNGTAAAYGGNIAFRGTKDLILKDNAAITGGTANGNGGNITLSNAGTLTMSGSTAITGGTAETGHGGNIANNSTGIVKITSGTIAGGSAPTGANLYLMNGTAEISDVTIAGGEATDESSIAMKIGSLKLTNAVVEGTLKLSGGTVSINGSDFGSIVIDENAKVYFDALTLKEGSALEKFLTGGFFKTTPDAAWVAEDYAVFTGTFENGEETYGFTVIALSDAPAFVPVISGTIAEKFCLKLQATGFSVEGMDDPFVRITRKGEDVDITEFELAEGKYIFTIEVNPEELADDLNPRLMVGETELDARPGYAVVTYVKALAEYDEATAELKTLLADLLEYGAAAQMFFNYKTDALANAEANRWADYAPSDYTAPATVPELNYSAPDPTVAIASANLWLEDDTVTVQFKGAAPSDATFTLNDEAAAPVFSGNAFTLRTAALKMSEITDAVFTAKVEKDGVSSSVTYGVANYIARITASTANENMKALAERLWAYGTSAKAYH